MWDLLRLSTTFFHRLVVESVAESELSEGMPEEQVIWERREVPEDENRGR